MRKDGEKVPVENYGTHSMQHEGQCYRCGTCGPANAEEHMAADAARQLLLKDDGTYRGDDTAIYLQKNFADNDCLILYKIDTNELCFETHKRNMHMYQYILHSYFIICVYM